MPARRLATVPDPTGLRAQPYLRVGSDDYGSYMGSVRRGSRRVPIEERFWDKVDRRGPDECWPWLASTTGKGYGQIGAGGRGKPPLMAHRVAYELQVGPIPPGLTIDHLCRNKLCQNARHLQPVSVRLNLLRGGSASATNYFKTECAHGHPLAGDNIIWYRGSRSCRECKNLRQRARWEAGMRSPSATIRPCRAQDPRRCKCRRD